MSEYATAMAKIIDPEEKYFFKLLTRKHCIKAGKYFIKDLRIFKNRKFEDIVAIDNTIISLHEQLENAIYIPAYKGEDNDTFLLTIKEFLIKISEVSDVRPYVTKFAGIRELYSLYLLSPKT